MAESTQPTDGSEPKHPRVTLADVMEQVSESDGRKVFADEWLEQIKNPGLIAFVVGIKALAAEAVLKHLAELDAQAMKNDELFAKALPGNEDGESADPREARFRQLLRIRQETKSNQANAQALQVELQSIDNVFVTHRECIRPIVRSIAELCGIEPEDLLRKWNFAPEVTTSAEDVVEALDEAQRGELPDLQSLIAKLVDQIIEMTSIPEGSRDEARERIVAILEALDSGKEYPSVTELWVYQGDNRQTIDYAKDLGGAVGSTIYQTILALGGKKIEFKLSSALWDRSLS